MAKRSKVNQNQFSFDFEAAVFHADQLSADINAEEEQNNENQTIRADGRSGQSVDIGNINPVQQMPGLESVRDEGSGYTGRQRAGRNEDDGTLWGASGTVDAGTGVAEPSMRSADQPAGDRTTGQWVGGNGNSGNERDKDNPINYTITASDSLGEGGAKAKFRDNIEALKTLKRLQETGASFASPDEQKALVRYVGWGGLPQAFDSENLAWKREFEELRQLLSLEEYTQARRSTQDAHYTSQDVINGIYQGLERMGFEGPAMVLEPSAGIGNFMGLMPEQWRNESITTAVELDPLSASIGQYLYPKVEYLNTGFQEANAPEDYFDLAVGNPPFGNQKIYDATRPDLDFSIHNYFLAKSIDSLREGGVGAFVVSRYFLDAQNNPARDYIAGKANLLGAIRLPNTAFKRNALTDVTTDIVFFQRTNEPEQSPIWLNRLAVHDKDGTPIKINEYYVENPGQMIGHMAMTHNMYRDSADLVPPPDFKGFPAEIASRLDALPLNIYNSRTDLDVDLIKHDDAPNIANYANLKIGAFFKISDGKLAKRQADILGKPQYELHEPKNSRAGERIVGMIGIRDTLAHLIKIEQSKDTTELDLSTGRAKLNRLYDAFIKKNGYLNSMSNRQAMRDDPSYPLLSSLEFKYRPGISKETAKKTGKTAKPPSAIKADIFKHRVLGPRQVIDRVESAKDALVVSMNEKGNPDLDFMEALYGRPPDAITDELAGLVYQNPTNNAWEIADHYLTGNVKGKLIEAQAAAEKDNRFKVNVESLQAVQPLDLDPVDIAVQLGSTWVPPEVVAEFGKNLFGPESVKGIGYHPALGSWVCEFNAKGIDKTLAKVTWGTERYYGHDLMASILNHTPIKVMDQVGINPETDKPIYEMNADDTAAANQKADEIKQAFKDWVWLTQDRRENLAKIYNDTFNTHIPRKYNGDHLELPGTSLAIKLRPHQKDAIWRGIQDGTALFDHVVGAGKTLVVVGTIMESRRMGLMKKPMVVVPNHLLTQWQDAFYSLYPQANLLVADKNDFKKENRKKLFAKVATGDWDAVVVAHSSFKFIDLPEKTLNKVLNDQVNDLTEAIGTLKESDGERWMIKDMEKTKERIKFMMQKRAETGTKDKGVTFDELGVDALFVDESQEFKNLFITTKMRSVSGLGNVTGSNKAFDMFVKCRYLQEKNDGRGVFFATGTPISNTIAEMYTVQRFLQYDMLKEKNIGNFDAWATTFGEVATGWELDATGVGYKLNSRFSKFQNVPELTNMYRTSADVITKQSLIEKNNGVKFTPNIKGGKPRIIIAERSDLQAQYMGVQEQAVGVGEVPLVDSVGNPAMTWTPDSIIYRMENLPDDPREDNPLKITNDARKCGLDFRLIDPSVPDFEGSKTNLAVAEITRIWKEWEPQKATQLVFCDLSTPKSAKATQSAQANESAAEVAEVDGGLTISMDDILSAGSKFSVYDDLRTKLISKGIPAHEIRFIHEANTDAQKAKLFEEVNQGEVRVLIGSTGKMGAGTNVQRRLVALHHLDCPWRPADIERAPVAVI